MIAIENILVSTQIVSEQFVCDLAKCKGACCVDGDAGAPLEKTELEKINEVIDQVLPYLNAESKAEIEKQGRYVYSAEFGWVTPTIQNKICVYGITDAQGIVKCAIEQAYADKKIQWKKPLSCHLFPIVTEESKHTDTIFVNYEPRKHNCKAACSLGKKLKVPVYVFLKEPLIRKFGQNFYESLKATALHLNKPTT